MKTAISIPDRTFEAAERAARRLGVSRSELYSNAVAEYVARYGRQGVTEALDEMYTADADADADADASVLDPMLDALQTRSLGRDDW